MNYIRPHNHVRRLLSALIVVVCLSWQLHAKDADSRLKKDLDALLESKLVKDGNIALGVWDAHTGERLYAHQDSLMAVPASTQKLFTTVAAIEQLGPQYRWQTTIGFRGQVISGVLKGDLIVQGGGDPSWNEDFLPQGPKLLFAQWADSLKARGISSIEGDFVANLSFYPPRAFNPAWELSDKPYYYAPAVSPISFNANRIVFELRGGQSKGKKVKISVLDGYDYIKLDNELKTSKKGSTASTWAEPTSDSLRFVIKGKVPAKGKAQEKIAIRDPEYFSLLVLKDVLIQKGIKSSGGIKTETVSLSSDSWQPLFTHYSPPLAEVLITMNKTSSNFLAETVLHSLSPDYNTALSLTLTTLSKMGVPVQGINIPDGSGLSRAALCSPAQMGSLLCLSTQQPWFELFFRSFPVAGKDGTLEKRFSKSVARGSVFAKTGSMKGISNLAGYVRTKDGRLLAVAVFCTQLKSSADARKWQESLCEILYRYSDDD